MKQLTPHEAMTRLQAGNNLSAEEIILLFDYLLKIREDAKWIEVFHALYEKHESANEIFGAVRWLRGFGEHVYLREAYQDKVIDCCGTGGDQKNTFNISTLAALTAACDGTAILKHCGGSASGGLGSADILETLQIPMAHDSSYMLSLLQKHTIAFLCARSFNHMLRQLAPLRKRLGHPSIFNIAAPLTHPVKLARQLVGVGRKHLIQPVAQTLQRLGIQKGIVVYGNGFDEFSTLGMNEYARIDGENISYEAFDPEHLDLSTASLPDLVCTSPAEAVDKALKVINGVPSPESDIVALNAGAILYLDDAAMSIDDGFYKAHGIILSGALKNLVDRLRS